MNFMLGTFLFSLGLFIGMLLLLEIGRRIGIRRKEIDPEGAHAGLGAVEGAVFALLGLLIAFTFSGAGSRLDIRRQLIVEEANAIGTAYLRLALLKSDVQKPLREAFRQYVETRVEAYQTLPDVEAAERKLVKAAAIQGQIWKHAVAACRAEDSQAAAMLLLPALNQMIDITATRAMAAEMHPPLIIYAMLTVLSLVSALIAGYGMTGKKTRSWIHIIGFAAITAATIFVILDIEHPRRGLIRIESADNVMLDLIKSMK